MKSTTDYHLHFQYENGTLQFIAQPEGYIYKDATGYRYVYQYKDHLGNNRLSFMRNAGTVAIVKETNYYPFGLTHQGYNNLTTSLGSAGAKKYQYNGKELQEDYGLDWYDYGARFYDAGLGRWFVADPLAEKAQDWSPYRYGFDNPIKFNDPVGLLEWKPQVDKQGNTFYIAEKGDNISTFKSQYGVSDKEAKKIFKANRLSTSINIKKGRNISGKSIKKVTGSNILKLNLTSPQATPQRKLDHLIFSLERSKKDGSTMDPKQYFGNIMEGTSSFFTGYGGFKGRGNINVGGKEVNVYYNAVINWNFKSQNHPVTISPTRGDIGKSTNAIIYQRANGKGFQSIQIVVPSTMADDLYNKLNK
jgi:RHS repeat-associated protein